MKIVTVMLNILKQLAFFVVFFYVISWIRESSLLPNETQAPKFSLTSLQGDNISLDQLKGSPTLIYFWAPWCSVCKVSLPNLQSFYHDNKAEMNIVSVALNYQQITDVTDVIVDKKIEFPTLLGDMAIAENYKIEGYPTYYILDSNGKVISKSMGYSTEIGMTLRSLLL